ncbi:MAG: primosomal protein N' [Gemmatimonadota bacterium]
MPLVELAFPVPLHRTFTYRLPEVPGPGFDGAAPAPGTRVLARLGRRQAVGFVVAAAVEAPPGVEVRPLEAVLDPVPLFSPALWQLAKWIADYYVAPLGLVLKGMLPPSLLRTGRRGSASPLPVAPTAEWVEALVDEPPPGLGRRARAQSRVLAALLAESAPLEARRLRETARAGSGVLAAMERAGLVRVGTRPAAGPRPAQAAARGEAAHPATPDQERALVRLRERLARAGAAPPRPFLLHGVTGSGKTLVYLRLVEEALARGGGAIVLVPEIGLTPRAAARFREAFGDRVALLHSALSDSERLEAWRAMRAGEVRVAVGPRSAVFAPLERVDVLVVDEEHETSYKQDESPRYNAREVAVVRARLEGGLAVLGSATPSLESYANALAGKYELLALPRRVSRRDLPEVQVVDLRGRPEAERILSRELRDALAVALERGEQGLLLLNRRGFSAFLQCVDCGATLGCPNCRITLTLHRARGGTSAHLRCHYCDHREPVPDACGACGGIDLAGRGTGTQQVEETVRAAFPAARLARMDHDTTTRRGAHLRLVEAMERGELDVLVGTQMVAKGHDFPGLTVVGVVSADTGLNVPDFRAAERTFQIVAQVAGRTGRGPAAGRVYVQSYVPDHPAIRAAAAHDYQAFYRGEVAARFEAGYPPALRLAACVLSGTEEDRVAAAARALAAAVVELSRERRLEERLTGLGPAPAPLSQLRGRFRWQYLLKSTSPATLEAVLRRLATRWRPPRGVQLALDRDPGQLL